MTCLQIPVYFGVPAKSGSHPTEADCLQACKEGACCEGTTCSVKPACQCQGTGKVFSGVGTTCESLSGACCEGTACSIKTSCECVGVGKTFKGAGTTCENVLCLCSCANFGTAPCSGFGLPAQYRVTISGLPSHLTLANGEWTVNFVTYSIDPSNQFAARLYRPTNEPPSYEITLALSCDSTSTALRYYYGVSVSSGTGGASATPVGGIAGGNFYLDATQPCQGQTLGTAFTAVVECIANPLP